MHRIFTRVVAVLAFFALWIGYTSSAQAQVKVLGNPSAGSQPVSILVPSNFSSWQGGGLAYFVNNTLQPRHPAGESRTYTPATGNGVGVRFHNASSKNSGNLQFANYRLYGGSYTFNQTPAGQLFIRPVAR